MCYICILKQQKTYKQMVLAIVIIFILLVVAFAAVVHILNSLTKDISTSIEEGIQDYGDSLYHQLYSHEDYIPRL